MHIVFVTTELATTKNSSGGLASFIANMARIFSAKGHKVTIVLSDIKEKQLEFDNNIELHTMFVKKTVWKIFDMIAKVCAFGDREKAIEIRRVLINIYRSKQASKKIKEISSKDKVDIVHYCNLGSLAFCANKNKNIPYVIRISGFPNMGKGADLPNNIAAYEDMELSMADRLINFTLKKAPYVISPSNYLAEIGERKWGIKATVIESPFVLEKSDWDYNLYNSVIKGKKYIIHYGSLRYLKGTHIVAQLAEQILRMNPGIFLVLAGNSEKLLDEEGKMVQADQLVKKSAIQFSDRVIYVGRLVREQLYPLIQNAELCLLPSRIENLSNACIEAMAMGKIVVATNGASYEQLIDDRISGFLCERDNPDSYLQAVNEALSMDAEEKEKMSMYAVQRTKRLAPDVIYEQYLEFYQKAVKEW